MGGGEIMSDDGDEMDEVEVEEKEEGKDVFIVDEDEEEENNEDCDEEKRRKRKKKRRQGSLQVSHEPFSNSSIPKALFNQQLSHQHKLFQTKPSSDESERINVLEEKYMMPKDDAIRATDTPERIQLMEEFTGPPPEDDESIAEESTWIYDELNNVYVSPLIGDDFELSKNIIKEHIGHVLKMLHCQKLDIPFIAKYRREFIRSFKYDVMPENEDDRTPIRRHKVLWAVHGLDKKWLLLQKRKSALRMYYSERFEEEARRIDDETRLALNKQIFSSTLEALKEAKSEGVVDDVDSKFNLHFPPGEIDVKGQLKSPNRKSLYNICYKAGLWEVDNKFGFNSEQFGLNLSLKRKLDELQDGEEVPEEVARNFTCAMFEKAEDVLKGARHMAAVEIGCEPVVRNHVRSIFLENAVVSTNPTPEGNNAIDVYHQFYVVKWLRNKPLAKFTDGQWLLIEKAEQEKLIQVNIKLPESVQNKLLADASGCYLSECVSKPAQLWNEQRKMILEDSFNNFILPSMEKEARSLLTARAKFWLQLEYAKQLWDKVSVAPYQRKGHADDIDREDELELRVMACCLGTGKYPNTFVMLDSAGEVVDFIYASSISIHSQGVVQPLRRKVDQERLLRFMTKYQPHVVCLGASNLAARQLKDEIYEVIFKIVEDHPRDVSQDMDISVLWGDESLPRLYEKSQISSYQLPEQPGIVKRTVALGRYLQNPLAMVATLCGPGKEILSWKLSPLDDFLTPDEKYDMVEQIMIDATNQVGVDVNLAASHEWLFAPLQFVAGLGPRKASALQREFVRSGSIFSRKLVSAGQTIRKKVFINCVGFLRIRPSGAAAGTSHMMDPLDDTRIHPESYHLAKYMTFASVSEAAVDNRNEMDEDYLELEIDRVRGNSATLEHFLIREFANLFLENFGIDKRETLADILSELRHGFKDVRCPFRAPNQDEEFSMLSRETDESLAEWRTVEATVLFAQDGQVVCSLNSGLRGFINAEDFSDEGYDPQKVKKGDIITCKIKFVNKNRFSVHLTCKESEMRRRQYIPLNMDPFYHEDVKRMPGRA